MEYIELSLPKDWNENEKLADPELLMLYKGFETRDVWLDTEVDQESCLMLVKYIQYLNKHSQDRRTPITLHIMSPGGDLAAMFMLYHTILTSEIPIHTINEAGAHSAAFIIFLAGHKRTMLPHATFIAHEGSGMMGGSFRESKMAMKQYEKDVETMKTLICERTNFTLEELTQSFESQQDLYIGYEMALEKGVITHKWDEPLKEEDFPKLVVNFGPVDTIDEIISEPQDDFIM